MSDVSIHERSEPSGGRYLCLACSQEYEIGINPIYRCPACKDDGIPADFSVRPEFKITWEELRCIVMWAERWASQNSDEDKGKMQRVVYGIADRLHVQHMDGPSLTFSQELADLRSIYGPVEQNVIKEGPHA